MKRLLTTGTLAALLFALSGCVYDPGSSYVRGDRYSGDYYYGTAYDRGAAYYGYAYDEYGYWPRQYAYGPTFRLGWRYDNFNRRPDYHGPVHSHRRR